MRYEIEATTDAGLQVKRLVVATTDAEALARFAADWTQHGDAAPVSPTITARWATD